MRGLRLWEPPLQARRYLATAQSLSPQGVLMRILALSVSATLAIATASTMPSAHAQTYDPKYPVCLQIYQGYTDYYFECAYTSIPQCQASASGRAAQCVVNPYYGGGKQRGKKRRRDY